MNNSGGDVSVTFLIQARINIVTPLDKVYIDGTRFFFYFINDNLFMTLTANFDSDI